MMPGKTQKYLKLQIFMTKKDNVTDADFHERWGGLHGDLCKQVPEFMQYVKRYNQVLNPSSLASRSERPDLFLLN
jgi:hypothetical protein